MYESLEENDLVLESIEVHDIGEGKMFKLCKMCKSNYFNF